MERVNNKINAPVSSDLFLSVVIPCYQESEILATLESLFNCAHPIHSTEIIVIINHSVDSSAEIKKFSKESFQELSDWIQKFSSDKIKYFVMLEEFESKNSGVGLARKTGMDEAAHRFQSIDKKDGVIVCLDADCTVDKNYLVEIEKHFLQNRKAKGSSIYFEHPTTGNESPEIYSAITLYEFFLRYYINALRWSGHPFAFQTIGSSMAVRADVYLQQGGMNKRKAGEDFYFLNKIIELGNFTEINGTTVFPSPRVSTRVPFGTGKAVADFIDEEAIWFYDFKVFEELKSFFEIVLASSTKQFETLISVPVSIKEFFAKENLQIEFDQIAENSSDELAYKKRFFRWFNLFRVLKFVHFFSDTFVPKTGNHEIARELFLHLKLPFSRNLIDDLKTLRNYDRINVLE